MALKELIAALERDAEEDLHAELARGRAEAAEIVAATDERLARSYEEALTHCVRELREEAGRRLAEGRREARRDVLVARQRLLERVYAAARARLPEAPREEAYLSALADEVELAIGYLGGRSARIRCAPALAARARKLLAVDPSRGAIEVVEDGGVGTGFIAESIDGVLEVDATLERRLHDGWPSLSLEVVALLGPRADTHAFLRRDTAAEEGRTRASPWARVRGKDREHWMG